jgi:hypothetical protein
MFNLILTLQGANGLIGTIGAPLSGCFLGNILKIFEKIFKKVFFNLQKNVCSILLRFLLKIY